MLDFNTLDTKFKDKVSVRPGGERLTNCYQCGTCTAGCPVSSMDAAYNPRNMMRMVLLGMKKEILSSPEIWQCTQCHICVAHCPQDVRFADVMRVLRIMAREEGYITEAFLEELDQLEMEMKQQRMDRIRGLIQPGK